MRALRVLSWVEQTLAELFGFFVRVQVEINQPAFEFIHGIRVGVPQGRSPW